ncbi:MAG TPA: hypothetical protein VGF75_00070 [Candidatus Saccharimonadales bacterium]
MKALVLYRPDSDHGRMIEEFISSLKSTGFSGKLETVNVDTREGISTATLYDITRYPAILVLRDDGVLQQAWEGQELPLINEVEAYFNA